MPIPSFDPTSGLLPPGEHPADWAEIRERLGWNVHRRRLLDGLRECLEVLGAAGCTRVWLNGSFVTAKDEPGDFDAVWSAVGVDRAVLEAELSELLDQSDHRAAQKLRFGGEFFPNIVGGSLREAVLGVLQTDREGTAKGILVIDPTKETWT